MATTRTRRFYVDRSTATSVGRTNSNAWHVIDRQSGRSVETVNDRTGARLAAEYYNAVHTDTDPKDLG